VVMPDRDGYEICEFIKRHPRLAHTPVLLMSGIVNDEVRERAARAQSAGILAKPFAADDLVRHLDALLAQRPAAATPGLPARESAPALEAAVARDTTPVPEGAAAILAQFLAMGGVQWAVLADREGFVVEATANAGVDADVAAALSACLAESSDGLGRELGRGALQGVILEYEKGMVVLYGVATSGLLAVGIGEPNVLGKVRYYARRALPELARGM
jgi:predicted regulator of Ras-like GTPase activity (Roadblock/LC7/MglB family)